MEIVNLSTVGKWMNKHQHPMMNDLIVNQKQLNKRNLSQAGVSWTTLMLQNGKPKNNCQFYTVLTWNKSNQKAPCSI